MHFDANTHILVCLRCHCVNQSTQYKILKGRSQRKKTILFGNFSQHGGWGVFPNPKTFVNLPSIFLYAKLGPKWPQMVKNMLYWSSGIILGPLRPLWDMFGHFWPQKGHYDKGFPKGGGGGSDVWEKFPNNIVFFFLERTLSSSPSWKNLRVFMSNINMDGTLEIKKFSFAALNPKRLDAK